MGNRSPKPLTAADFAALVTACPVLSGAGRVAVAVSGGADSMALALLAADWAKTSRVGLTALTVDHGLRPEAAGEARQVGTWLRGHGIDHDILTWRGAKPRSNVQALARRARYALMDEWCGTHGAGALLLAHHLEDQAETVLLRLGRGSGVYGLAGMAAETAPAWPGAPAHVRPLLPVSRDRLRMTLEARGQSWVADPSNEDPAYNRVKVRQLWPRLDAVGITPDRVAQTAAHMARARAALDGETDRLLADACVVHGAGYATVRSAALRSAHEEIGLRALARMLQAVGGGDYGPRFDSLERLFEGMTGGTLGGGATLSGCRISPLGDEFFLIAREPRAMEGALVLQPGRQVWDGRYLVTSGGAPRGLRVARLGRDGLREAREHVDSEVVSRIPALVRPVLAGVFDDHGLAAVPALNYIRPACGPVGVAFDYLPRYNLPSAAFRG